MFKSALRSKKAFLAALIFFAVYPTVHLFIRDYSFGYLTFKFSRILNCLFGMQPLVDDPRLCSEFSTYVLVRDAILFAYYPISILLCIAIVFLGVRTFMRKKKVVMQAA